MDGEFIEVYKALNIRITASIAKLQSEVEALEQFSCMIMDAIGSKEGPSSKDLLAGLKNDCLHARLAHVADEQPSIASELRKIIEDDLK
jgi:hypothetical protein